ncbi:cadherin-related [Schistosoma mansoni]|uniref:cadherin-related n=1 Tax=Schistosoma mansoni TaxID=6183 RepID=UPI0001A63F3B|nr:cadherin-related [Schistosoma mansoni]|eukprot:XP_018652329.1 cadherin-related [Schistosoma mansoni]
MPQIQAVDDDAGENGTVIYFIHSGNDQNYFTLHKNTGTLSINKEIPYTAIGGLTLKIEARDCGQPYHYTRTDLILEIDDSPSKAYLSMNLYHLNNDDNDEFMVHSIPDCLSQFSSIGGQTSLELTNYPNGRLLSSPYQDSMLDKCSNRNISTEYWDYNNDNNNQGGINTIKMNRNNDLMDHQKIEIYIPSCQYMKMMDLTDETDLKYSYDARSNYYDETQRKFSLKAYPNDGIIQ